MTQLTSPKTSPGALYIVATPIGNLDDITIRAIETLKQVDLIAAEDTRYTGRLLQHLSINNKLFALHDHNEQQKIAILMGKLKLGQSIALVSDAGTPLINDPGYHLVKRCHQEGIRVIPIPGPCAAITALSAAGIASDRFCYEGFLPAKKKARQDKLNCLAKETRTIIFYESPHRLCRSLNDIAACFGTNRYVVLAKELTKTWETILGMPVSALIRWLEAEENRQKGEFVLIVEGYHEEEPKPINANMIKTLKQLMNELPIKKAAAITADIYDVPKNQLYKIALNEQS